MREKPVLIAQITDCHIGFDRDNPEEDNVQRLRAVFERLRAGPNRPDLVLMTGDLTGYGEPENYARLTGVIAGQPFPVHLMIGNWDRRDELCAAIPQTPTTDGFVQFEVALPGLRLIALDTNEAGRHGGAFCDRRAAWLSARLDADPVTPVVIAMHHPPVETGIAWLDSGANEAWIARFGAVIEGRPQVRAIIAGHMHRPIFTMFAGVPLAICPSSAPHVELDLSPLDPEHPDGRPLVVDDPAGYALHRWDGQRLISHFEWVRPGQTKAVYASFDASMAKAVSQNARERLE
jgi:3',5'-cyclic AMP phosphodiesterase CpdA